MLLVLGNRQAGQVTAALGGSLEAQGPHGQGAVISIPRPSKVSAIQEPGSGCANRDHARVSRGGKKNTHFPQADGTLR